VIHGTADDIVDVAHARSYGEILDDGHVVVELEGVDHFKVIDPNDPVFETVLAAISQLQRGAGSD
jgi:hypothetical protein